jgi:hypothetical protein
MNHSTKQYKLNVISKHSEKLKISIVVGGMNEIDYRRSNNIAPETKNINII